jgi:pimeloyl-ACP methyl ester carboxylesterase
MKTLKLLVYFLLVLNSLSAQEVFSFKTSDGETLFYTKAGNGPKVIFLAGGPGYGSTTTNYIADSLLGKFECILFDQRGTGLSTSVKIDSTTINLQRAVLDIEDLRKHLGIKQILFCGISWGGLLAQAYTSVYPENVKKLVLLCPSGPDTTYWRPFSDNILMRIYPNEMDSLIYWSNQPTSDISTNKQKLFFLQSYFYDHKIGYDFLTKNWLKAPFSQNVNDNMGKDLNKGYDLKPGLAKYIGDCVILKPRQDVIPEEVAFQIKEVIPQTKIIFIERSGHVIGVENPKDFFLALKKAFSDNLY